MSFLGLPCPCGWALTENENGGLRFCEKCGRRYALEAWGWNQVTPRAAIRAVSFCRHRREPHEGCPHCAAELKGAGLDGFYRSFGKPPK